MLITDVLAATSNSDDTTFSIPILVAAAAVCVGWIVLLVAVAAWRRPHGIRSGPATQDLPPVPPAVAGLVCNDFELPAELPPGTLLDLAARHVVRLEEVEPGKTICRLRGAAGNEPLTRYEQRVLDEVRRYARRRPVMFLALCGLAGVVAGRITRGAVAANTSVDSPSATPARAAYTTTGGDYAAPTSTYGAYTDAPAGAYSAEATYPTETTYPAETTSVEYADRGDPIR